MHDACKTYVPGVGCLLLVSAPGAGPLSIDAQIAAGAAARLKPALAQNA
jgi:hypothetical protein